MFGQYESYWENLSGLSDDEYDVSDADSSEGRSFIPESDSDDDSNHDGSNATLEVEEVVQQSDDDDDLPLSTSLPAKQKKAQAKSIKEDIDWKSKSLELNEDQLRFHGDTELSAEIMSLKTHQFFSFLFSEELIAKITEKTNLYSVQTKPKRPPIFTQNEMNNYFGIIIHICLVHMPNIRSFWSEELRFAPIADVMPVNKFEKIRQVIHVNNNATFIPRDQPGHDRLYKIRPLVD
ncbi:hypothetical protein JTB14_000252 [Gonioctena quinquepunctata]|nr:hypothetical protein JTB14_000252 [Gonioctena quinquepunctata]